MSQFSQLLLSWYQSNQRNLPWRVDKNPYYIWISEIMLQQTQVVTVIPYFLNFIQSFPTIADLAHSDENKLMKAWEGLGYYSRARNLRVAANQIESDFDGKMPTTKEELLSLKGIGPYTASAIASIAFNEVTPAIDGNAFRVFSRVRTEASDIGESKSRVIFEEIGRQLISEKHPGDFNQAIMDLGSQICTPKAPECEACPVNTICLAFKSKTQLDFPKKAKKIKKKDIYLIADLLINDENQLLFEQRADAGVLKNMWLFPMREVDQAEYLELEKRAIAKVKHVFTHLNWHILLIPELSFRIAEATKLTRKWLSLKELDNYPIPTVQYKLIDKIPKTFLR
ncbi:MULTISPECIES: A/G-specific adenine glycosylase [unclassified Enterococcus]|uniref:A/G-specific adenine glycosylase n=1 Tax=unclassified Enterococcus TaxID=2608891 RepID=UPI0015577E94|nr:MULTISPECIES: A/G-specific adenine glycosylase [unclassified Enterococcus]MBS7577831.1 A/G-specific adenine glycosylase [Enterococcus sp. MMGLQ5-2]MBS7585091.1 A/G-specific adenine glycosylase [Enterococcus sp. MMGLQ5-1]NPD12947.1 A/G-specific adenine glycosylase [Enterococcus sp. MMGLQ5-1]NPD37661.1 A/G-specific adenine glycosylase [Enterococcus sp. MMGLQ5-2]